MKKHLSIITVVTILATTVSSYAACNSAIKITPSSITSCNKSDAIKGVLESFGIKLPSTSQDYKKSENTTGSNSCEIENTASCDTSTPQDKEANCNTDTKTSCKTEESQKVCETTDANCKTNTNTCKENTECDNTAVCKTQNSSSNSNSLGSTNLIKNNTFSFFKNLLTQILGKKNIVINNNSCNISCNVQTIKKEETPVDKTEAENQKTESKKEDTEKTEQETVPSKNEPEKTENIVTPTEKEEEKQDTTTSDNSKTSYEQEVLNLVNVEREKNGLSKLTYNTKLETVAYAHSKDMAQSGFFNHTNLNGQSPFDRLKNAGISYKSAAENIAAGQKTPKDVVTAWMNSEGHRKNILNPSLTQMGVGVYEGGSYGIYWTQLFIG